MQTFDILDKLLTQAIDTSTCDPGCVLSMVVISDF
jgi:hypothetical protein